jgi:hypothetical protein
MSVNRSLFPQTSRQLQEYFIIIIIIIIHSGVRLSVSWYCGHSWPIVPASGDSEDDCGEADGM